VLLQLQAAADVQIQQLKEQLKVADVKNDSISGRKGQLEVRLAENEERFALMEMELKSKDAELERTKAAGEQLSRQLLAAQASRKTGEEEFERNRLDMQVQMDRLRSNMHVWGIATSICFSANELILYCRQEMLIRGGEKAEIANVQNQELQREADMLRHELQLYQQGKLHLDKEASYLRTELQVIREAERVGALDLASARDQVNRLMSQSCRLSSCIAVKINFNFRSRKVRTVSGSCSWKSPYSTRRWQRVNRRTSGCSLWYLPRPVSARKTNESTLTVWKR
jgi:hypothetical protein